MSELAADLRSAYNVLSASVESLSEPDRSPTASEVRVEMRRRTYGGFDPKALGFKRFRDFLSAAESNGEVELIDRPGDIAVSRPGYKPEVETTGRVRRDLWRAVLDWSDDVDHYFDLASSRSVALPREPVPLEPQKFAELRQRVSDGDPELLLIPSVSIQTQQEWMRRFVESLADLDLKRLLEGALAGDKPAKFFNTVLRNDPSAQHRWHNALSVNVIAHLRKWQEDEPTARDLELVQPQSKRDDGMDGPSEQRDDEIAHNARRALIGMAGSLVGAGSVSGTRAPKSEFYWPKDRKSNPPTEQTLRYMLHAAIDRMPESELRAVRIPVGYLLED